MAALLWIYGISTAIIVIFAFSNKEARGIKMGDVTISSAFATLLIAIIPIVNTLVVIGYLYARWTDWRMTMKMTGRA